jgi:TetR/AcrR family transcriptional regulator, fatty acid biosynthesis regulator
VRRRSRRERGPELTREERKLRTRRALVESALGLMGEERSFTSLSLREVARHAGVVPNAFYRHFRDMDALGLALIEEGGLTLRRLLRQVRETGLPPTEILRRSVEIYVQYVRAHRLHFLFIARERAGGSPAIRAGIRREVGLFTAEMTADLGALGVMPNLGAEARLMIAEMIVQMMLEAAVDIIDLPSGKPDREAALVSRLVSYLVVVMLGARAWREGG